MTASPLFSIVLPTYNRSAMLGRAIQSVFDQDFGDFELLVVDDGSDDPYVSAWEGCDRRIRILRNPDNRGVGAARNLGIAAAHGKYVSFLDDDDEYAPTFLSSTRSLLCDAAAGVALSWCGARFVNDTLVAERRSDRTREFHETRLGQRQLFEGLLSIGTGFGVTIELQRLREIGAFDCSLQTVEDTDLFLRFLIRGLVHLCRSPPTHRGTQQNGGQTTGRLL
jgi:glycosyltransferase involved in cell wall biosynthesis